MNTENFKTYFEYLNKQSQENITNVDKSLSTDLINTILIIEEYARGDEEKIQESIGNIGRSLRDFLEPFLEYFIIENFNFSKLNISNYSNYSSSDKIKFLNENVGLNKDIKNCLYSINNLANDCLHSGNTFLLKSDLIKSLFQIARILHWHLDVNSNFNFKENRYHIPRTDNRDNAQVDIKKTFPDEPFKKVKVNDEKIINILFDDKIDFIIPIYQRSYSWEEDEIEELFFDLGKRIKDDKEHFFGPVNLAKDTQWKKGNKIIQKIKIIDGQQRFTTITLLLATVYQKYLKIFKNENKIDSNLVNFINGEIPIGRYDDNVSIAILKLIWTNKVKDLENNTNISESYYEKNNIYKIYKFIQRKINKYELEELDNLYNALGKLVIGINWTKDFNEFELFESINSKGKILSHFDMLKNFLISLIESKIEENNTTEIVKIFQDIIASKLEKIKDQKMKDELIQKFLEKYILFHSGKSRPEKKRIFSQFKEVFLNEIKNQINKQENLDLIEFTKISFELGKFLYAVLLTNSQEKEVWKTNAELSKYYKYFYSLIETPIYSSILIPYFINEEKFDFTRSGVINKVNDPKEFQEILNFLEKWKIRREIVYQDHPGTAIQLMEFTNDLNRKLKLNDNEEFYKTFLRSLNEQTNILSLPPFNDFISKLENGKIINSKIAKIILFKILNNEKKAINEFDFDNYDLFNFIDPNNKKRTEEWNSFVKNANVEENIFYMLGNNFIFEKNTKLKRNIKQNLNNLISNLKINKTDENITIEIEDLLKLNPDNLDNFIKNRSKKFAEYSLEIFK